ncbi:MAG: homoserine kinase [Verrucomicrobiota bacterium]
MKSVTVRVPATTANLGPGYDCMGIALKLYNTATIRPAQSNPRQPFLREIIERFFSETGLRRRAFHIKFDGDVPSSRGLGSSVTVRLGLLMALNEFYQNPLSPTKVLDLTVELEGHPDNAVPAFHGGFCACIDCDHIRAEVPLNLKFIAVIPSFKVKTEEARTVIPKRVSHKDAVTNLRNSAMITGAFCTRQYEKLAGCFVDKLHQPYRAKLIPGFDETIDAAIQAGALGAFLSGSGSTIMAISQSGNSKVANAMRDALRNAGHKNIVDHVLAVDNEGAKVLRQARKY